MEKLLHDKRYEGDLMSDLPTKALLATILISTSMLIILK
jgi:hypothetical protein